MLTKEEAEEYAKEWRSRLRGRSPEFMQKMLENLQDYLHGERTDEKWEIFIEVAMEMGLID